MQTCALAVAGSEAAPCGACLGRKEGAGAVPQLRFAPQWVKGTPRLRRFLTNRESRMGLAEEYCGKISQFKVKIVSYFLNIF